MRIIPGGGGGGGAPDKVEKAAPPPPPKKAAPAAKTATQAPKQSTPTAKSSFQASTAHQADFQAKSIQQQAAEFREASIPPALQVGAPQMFGSTMLPVPSKDEEMRAEVEKDEKGKAERAAGWLGDRYDDWKVGVGIIKDEVKDVVGMVKDQTGTIKLLDEGDSFRMRVGGEVKVEATVGAAADITVTSKGGKYEVEVGGEASVGVVAEIAKFPGLDAPEAEAKAGARASYTMTFDSAEEAARAAEIVQRSAIAASAASSGAPTIPGLAPSKDDLEFLKDHRTSVTVSGSAAASVSGELGIEGIPAGIGAGGSAGTEQSVTYTFAKDGEPATIEVSQSASVAVEAGVGPADGEEGDSGSVGASVKVSASTTIEVPDDLDADFSEDPLAAAKEIAKRTGKSAETTFSIEGTGTAAATLAKAIGAADVGVSGELTGSLSFTAKPSELGPDFWGNVTKGELGGALGALGDGVKVEASLASTVQVQGVDVSEDLSLFGVGIGLEFAVEQLDRTEHATYSGTAGDLAKKARDTAVAAAQVAAGTGKVVLLP